MTGVIERAVLHRLAESTGRAIDIAYTSLVHQLGITDRFFPDGFGNLEAVPLHEDVELFEAWPPPHFANTKIDWKRVREGKFNGAAYDVFKATFPTPVSGRSYDALPIQSRTAYALWVLPRTPAPGSPTSIHLAATGDHGFARREHLGIPLVAQGIGTLALESPYYGQRRPDGQQGAKLRYVSDLLLLGRATIEESLFLLQWLQGQGHEKLGIAGLSMGGVHASMVASLYPGPLALAPMLAPRSAAVAYCGGALFHATAWNQLMDDSSRRHGEIIKTIERAARAGQRLAEARIRLEELERQIATEHARVAALKDTADSSSSVVGTGAAIQVDSKQQQPTSRTTTMHTPAAASLTNPLPGLKSWLSNFNANLAKQLRDVGRLEGNEQHKAAVQVLATVLETYTDVTRFPLPQRPDAAVLVAATEDAYVSPESVLELHRHLPGSEIRWVPGGHVSSFVLHQSEFRKAIADSLNRL